MSEGADAERDILRNNGEGGERTIVVVHHSMLPIVVGGG
jgi:hypothetical protein